MAAVSEAKEYLRLMRTTPTSQRGPHRLYDDQSIAAPMLPLAKRVHSDIIRIDERTYRAPSAWHAAAWMLDQAALIGQIASVDGSSGLVAASVPHLGAPVFRGQRDPAWKLAATMFRADSSPPHVVLALELFIDAMTELMAYDENRINGRFVHMAGAQHYGEKTTAHEGMLTPLLDFTADPCVAVYFACRGSDATRDREVVVYGVPLTILGRGGGRIILPPPWLKRLWAQRGLFLDCTSIPPSFDFRQVCFQVLFPPDQEFAHSIFEHGDAALLPTDPWFEQAIAWAIASAKSLMFSPPSKPLGEWLSHDCGDPPFRWFALMTVDAQQHSNQFIDMCEWLALKVVDRQLTYDLKTLDLILKDNEPLFRAQRVVWKFLQNLLGDLTAVPDRTLQALYAISLAVEAAFASKEPESMPGDPPPEPLVQQTPLTGETEGNKQ